LDLLCQHHVAAAADPVPGVPVRLTTPTVDARRVLHPMAREVALREGHAIQIVAERLARRVTGPSAASDEQPARRPAAPRADASTPRRAAGERPTTGSVGSGARSRTSPTPSTRRCRRTPTPACSIAGCAPNSAHSVSRMPKRSVSTW